MARSRARRPVAMRSFIGILGRDGSPPDRGTLENLATRIALPGSPRPEIAIDGRCGVAGVSRSGGSSAIAREESVWAVADAIDASDVVLRAWRTWGADCVTHLNGEFAFAIWDAPSEQLFCARDRFGVRPFFYAETGRTFVFSDCLEAVIAHAEVPVDELDDAAVADYLVTGVYEEAQATIFRHVRRLPPAHVLTIDRNGARLRRYWDVPGVAAAARTKTSDAPSRLESALRVAIADRVRFPSAVAFMSGGLDSPTLAVLAREQGTDVVAITSAYRNGHDIEEVFAIEAAESIGIPHRTFVLDAYTPLQVTELGLWTADPGALLTLPASRAVHSLAAQHAPVALHGHPADAVLAFDPAPYLRSLLSDPAALIGALVQYTRVKRRLPYFFIRELAGLRRRIRPEPPPDWLRLPMKIRHLDLDQPLAVRALRSADWSSYFEWAHPLVTGAPIELTYPWADPRVIEAALALEPIPWLIDKHVLREVLRGRVSEGIRRRPKTMFRGTPFVSAPQWPWPEIESAARFIDPERYRAACRAAPSPAGERLRAAALEYWLRELPNRVGKLRSAGSERA